MSQISNREHFRCRKLLISQPVNFRNSPQNRNLRQIPRTNSTCSNAIRPSSSPKARTGASSVRSSKHVGGRRLLEAVGLQAGLRVLDVASGVGAALQGNPLIR
jgi:hypothetical protein